MLNRNNLTCKLSSSTEPKVGKVAKVAKKPTYHVLLEVPRSPSDERAKLSIGQLRAPVHGGCGRRREGDRVACSLHGGEREGFGGVEGTEVEGESFNQRWCS